MVHGRVVTHKLQSIRRSAGTNTTVPSRPRISVTLPQIRLRCLEVARQQEAVAAFMQLIKLMLRETRDEFLEKQSCLLDWIISLPESLGHVDD